MDVPASRPPTSCEGLVAFRWNALDEWFAEAEQLFGHPRDPYSRIDVCRTTRRVRVLLDGEVLADSRRARVLYEAALPPRWYLPAEDVRTELLIPSGSSSRCAYKGAASYWHVRVGDRVVEDLVWSYPDPAHDAEPVRDMLCFFGEKVDIELDGVVGDRPATQWSPVGGRVRRRRAARADGPTARLARSERRERVGGRPGGPRGEVRVDVADPVAAAVVALVQPREEAADRDPGAGEGRVVGGAAEVLLRARRRAGPCAARPRSRGPSPRPRRRPAPPFGEPTMSRFTYAAIRSRSASSSRVT